MSLPATVILMRHGESTWNAEDRFAGWVDVPLTDHGRDQARAVGRLFAARGQVPGAVYTSDLRRAVETAELVTGRPGWPQLRQLNERHYGALQGRRRADALAELGEQRFRDVRRSWSARPPAGVGQTHGYRLAKGAGAVGAESLRDVSARVLACWRDTILPELTPASVTLVVAHGNSLRALVKELESISDDDCVGIEIEIAAPRTYIVGLTD
jgi:2,3-bisphosphoglycerate-dependent phosphoglycerate mutase